VLYTIKGAREFHRGLKADPDTVAARALGDFTLEVELVQPNSYFLQKLRDLAFLPIPRHCVAQHGPAWNEPGKLVSNGLFFVQDWQPGQSMRLRRNPHYHGEFPGNLEAVDIKLVPDTRSSEVLAMYTQGEVDVMDLGPETLPNRHHFPGEYIQQQANAIFYLGVNILRSPLDNRRVRRALGLAIDKQALTEQALRGWLAPATGGFIPPGIPGHSPEISLPYDPDQARRLLAQAGFPNERDFPILTLIIHHNNRAAGEYLQRQWADVLKVELQIRTTKDLGALFKLAKETDLFWAGFYPFGMGDPEPFLGEGIFNHPFFSDWDHPGYNRALKEARQCQGQQQRLQFYQQADRILIDEAVVLPLGYLLEHWLAKPWVRNWDYLNLRRVILEPH
jgi:oligopeptide transport system substrate-binding protein